MTLRMKERQLFWMDKALQSAFVKMRGLMGRLDSKAKSKRQVTPLDTPSIYHEPQTIDDR